MSYINNKHTVSNIVAALAVAVIVAIFAIASTAPSHQLSKDVNTELNSFLLDKFVFKKNISASRQQLLWHEISYQQNKTFDRPVPIFNFFQLEDHAATLLKKEFGIPEHYVYQKTVIIDKEKFMGGLSKIINYTHDNVGCHRDFAFGMLLGTKDGIREHKRLYLSVFDESCLRMCEKGDGPHYPWEHTPWTRRVDPNSVCQTDCEAVCSPTIIDPYLRYHQPINGTESILMDFTHPDIIWQSNIFECVVGTMNVVRWVAGGGSDYLALNNKMVAADAGYNFYCSAMRQDMVRLLWPF